MDKFIIFILIEARFALFSIYPWIIFGTLVIGTRMTRIGRMIADFYFYYCCFAWLFAFAFGGVFFIFLFIRVNPLHPRHQRSIFLLPLEKIFRLNSGFFPKFRSKPISISVAFR